MGELQKFDYGQLDEKTASFLRQKESNMREIVGKAYTELGRELYEAQQALARKGSKYEGVFEKWYTSMGFKKRSVYNYINRYKLVQQLHKVDYVVDVEEIPNNLAYEIASPNAESTPAKAQAKAEVLAGEIDTLKEYRERVKQLEKEAEQERKRAEQAERYAEEKENEVERLKAERKQQEKLQEDPSVTEALEYQSYGVKLAKEMYAAFDELSEWQKKYAWIITEKNEFKTLAESDPDFSRQFERLDEFWRQLSYAFGGERVRDTRNVVNVDFIEI